MPAMDRITTSPSCVAAAPYYPFIDLYPSSPLIEFPPPLASIATPRRALNERKGINLRIKTSFAHSQPNPVWSPKGHGHSQPHRNNLPRRRVTKRMTFYDESEEHVSPRVSLPKKSAVQPAVEQPRERRHLQEVVPGLFFAFRFSDETSESLRAFEEGYTHLVEICFPDAGEAPFPGASEQLYEGRVHRLRLVLPMPTSAATDTRAGLALTDAQLRTTRDFLAQALPYSASQLAAPTGVRVLLTTPVRRPTDAMSIAGCYLAFASGKSVETVLRYIDDEESFLSVWKSEVSGDEMEKAERVARAWSWLSGIRR